MAGAWRHPGRIHLLEAKVSLMGLRNAAVSRRSEDCVVLSLGDNMAEVLATERGRARDRGLNACCRQSFAWQLAAGVDWRRRYVPTDKNISDSDSRLADRGALEAGEVMIPAAAAHARAHKRAGEVQRVLTADFRGAPCAFDCPRKTPCGLCRNCSARRTTKQIDPQFHL